MIRSVADEHLALLEQSLANIENDYRPTCESVSYGSGCPGPTDASLDFWRRAVDVLPAMLVELRARRAAELAAEMRPPMSCMACEDHNHKLYDRIIAMQGAVCDACRTSKTFMKANVWPLPEQDPISDEEFEALCDDIQQSRERSWKEREALAWLLSKPMPVSSAFEQDLAVRAAAALTRLVGDKS